jgi:hypothetical protein
MEMKRWLVAIVFVLLLRAVAPAHASHQTIATLDTFVLGAIFIWVIAVVLSVVWPDAKPAAPARRLLPKKGSPDQRRAAARLKRVARELKRFQTQECQSVSRQDNNQIFEIDFFLRHVADRIKAGYDDTDYPRLIK